MLIDQHLKESCIQAIHELYQQKVPDTMIQIQETRRDLEGDFTLVVFPLLRISKKAPEATGEEIGAYLKSNLSFISEYNIVKGFLNLIMSDDFWFSVVESQETSDKSNKGERIMVEFSSPNTNKPLHLGHIRNILLGDSVSRILTANGHSVKKVNLVNDRGIHICKSMLAWKKWGENRTPEQAGKKGDHWVGDFYVKFDQEYKKQVEELKKQGIDEASEQAPLLLEAREMLKAWENGDKEVHALWEEMNSWVYSGFDQTYNAMGIEFDKIYYESQTYKLGKKLVLDGLKKGVFTQKPDSSVWADLSNNGLDEKILLRSDGTSVYMTQDLGTAHQRFEEFNLDKHIYVVGNEQNYHFQVLKLVLEKLGFDWADKIYHLSYGMVELPSGKMKSREGTVVDADDLIDEMVKTAEKAAQESGKLDGIASEEKKAIINMVALGALKYFILKVDPKKNMTFNPEDSIDFNGNTGPFIQYTHARICSVLRKATERGIDYTDFNPARVQLNDKEKNIVRTINRYPQTLQEAGENQSPALLANHVYGLAKDYNHFYQELPILKEENEAQRTWRLKLSERCAEIIADAMNLLGIDVPERM